MHFKVNNEMQRNQVRKQVETIIPFLHNCLLTQHDISTDNVKCT